MKRFHSHLVAALIAVSAAAALNVAGLSGQGPHVTMPPFLINRAADSMAGQRSTEVATLVARGDELTATRQYAAGKRVYGRAAQLARRQGQLPSVELWRLAAVSYFDGQNGEAARTLDDLATEAGEVGDLVVEARAVLGAAWLYGQAGRPAEARSRVAHLQKLLRSPYLPADVQAELSARLPVAGAVVTR